MQQDAEPLPNCPPRQKSFTGGRMGQDDFTTYAAIQGERELKRSVVILFNDYFISGAGRRKQFFATEALAKD